MMIEARCNRCGRSTIAPEAFDRPDDMPQPDGRPCGGTFVIPPGPLDFDVYPRRESTIRPVPEELVQPVAAALHARWKDNACAHVGKWFQCEVDARTAIIATLEALVESDDAVAVLAPHFGAEAWMADPPNDARDALRDLAKWAQKSAVEAPTVPSKSPGASPMGEDSGQT